MFSLLTATREMNSGPKITLTARRPRVPLISTRLPSPARNYHPRSARAPRQRERVGMRTPLAQRSLLPAVRALYI